MSGSLQPVKGAAPSTFFWDGFPSPDMICELAFNVGCCTRNDVGEESCIMSASLLRARVSVTRLVPSCTVHYALRSHSLVYLSTLARRRSSRVCISLQARPVLLSSRARVPSCGGIVYYVQEEARD